MKEEGGKGREKEGLRKEEESLERKEGKKGRGKEIKERKFYCEGINLTAKKLACAPLAIDFCYTPVLNKFATRSGMGEIV